jgi:hypothetical protein
MTLDEIEITAMLRGGRWGLYMATGGVHVWSLFVDGNDYWVRDVPREKYAVNRITCARMEFSGVEPTDQTPAFIREKLLRYWWKDQGHDT